MGGMIALGALLVLVALAVAALALMAILELEREQRIAAHNLVPLDAVVRSRTTQQIPSPVPVIVPKARTAAGAVPPLRNR